jgi:hypothetical protein
LIRAAQPCFRGYDVWLAHKSSKRTLQELLVPYRRALGDPTVPGSASDHELLPPIEADLAELARWTRVSGWPFRRQPY